MELVPVGLVNQIYLRCKFKGKKKSGSDPGFYWAIAPDHLHAD